MGLNPVPPTIRKGYGSVCPEKYRTTIINKVTRRTKVFRDLLSSVVETRVHNVGLSPRFVFDVTLEKRVGKRGCFTLTQITKNRITYRGYFFVLQ